jgi:cytochrome c oxidase assembly protein subunit 15
MQERVTLGVMPATTAPPLQTGAQTIAHRRQFQRFAWAVLGWNILVVLWGAYVRASGSGAGCGNHWPFCNGEVVPRAPQLTTIIEFTHRMMSGVALILVVALYLGAVWRFPKAHIVRRVSAWGIGFMLTEALLGAGLVLFRYVDHNESVGRAIYLSAHLVNTQLLLAVLTMAAVCSAAHTPQFTGSWPARLFATLAIALGVSVTGTIAALGDTLYPAVSFAAGVHQEMSATASILLRLRIIHPMIAIMGALYIAAIAILWIREDRKFAFAAAFLTVAQLGAGALNVALLAPIWMQIVHLLIADLLWITLVLLCLRSSARPSLPVAPSDT